MLLFCVFPLVAGAAQSGGLLVPPIVQLGDRVKNGERSVSIVWQSADIDDTIVLKYSQGGSEKVAMTTISKVAVAGVEPHRVMNSVIRKYRPGVPIHYRLTRGATTLAEATFMAPKSDRQNYRFAVFGDCGIGAKPQAEVSYQVDLQRPDMVLLTGDIVYGDGRASEYRKNFFPYYTTAPASPATGSSLMSTSLTVAAPGNHDILHRDLNDTPDGMAYYYYWSQPLNGPLTKFGDPSTPVLEGTPAHQEAFRAAAGVNYPRMSNFSFDYGNAHVTSLDANPYVDWGRADLRAWLKKDLAKGARKKWRFVMFHHPGFHSSDKHQTDKQMRKVADIFEDGKVDVVFAGHVHNYQRTFPIQVGPKRGAKDADLAMDDWPVDRAFDGKTNTKPKGVIYIVTGAGGNYLYDLQLNGNPSRWKPFQAAYAANFSFTLVDVAGKTFKLRQIDNKGNEIDAITITK